MISNYMQRLSDIVWGENFQNANSTSEKGFVYPKIHFAATVFDLTKDINSTYKFRP